MGAMAIQQAVAALLVVKEHQVFAHQAHRLDRIFLHLGDRCDLMPVKAHKFGHRSSRTDLGEDPVGGFAQHRDSSCAISRGAARLSFGKPSFYDAPVKSANLSLGGVRWPVQRRTILRSVPST